MCIYVMNGKHTLTDISGAIRRFLCLFDSSESVDDELLESEAWHNLNWSAVRLV